MAKLSKKKKMIVIISSVLIVAIAGTITGVAAAKQNQGTEVQFQTITAQNIASSINATADVEAGATREYKVGSIAKVKEVFVKVGDRVTEGQILATFDTSSLDQQISQMQKQYSSTAASYQASLAAAKDAKAKIAAVDAEIAELEARIASNATSTTQAADIPTITLPDIQIPESVYDKIEQAIKDMIESGKKVDSEVIKKAIEDAINEAIKQGIIQGADGVNMDDLLDSMNKGVVGEMNDQMRLANLKIQRQIQEVTANASLADTTKSLMSTTSQAIEALKEQRDELAEGWRADFNGLITQVNIQAGSDATLLKAGIVLQGTDVMTAVLTLGKYDLQKVTVGMPCKITVVNGTYDGEVSFIAPTAENSGSSSEILDQMSSSFGISGLGSLTGSTGGVRCEITIFGPDEKVVIGLDANVEIQLEEKTDAVALPVECLKIDKEGKYVFVYNEEEKTVEKRTVTLGINSDLYYEVTEGLKKGDKVASSELSSLEDGQKVKVSTKTTKK